MSEDAYAQGDGAAQTNQVTMQGNAFVPSNIIILVGTEVTWTNQDSVVHSVTSDDGEFDEDPVFIGETDGTGLNEATIAFESEGVFTYHCNYHGNMVGRIEVVTTLDAPVIRIEATDDNVFRPDLVTINATQSVSWENVGEVQHNLVFEDPDIGTVGELGPGQTLNLTFDRGGSFRYRCGYHSADYENGMVAKIVAGNASVSFPPLVSVSSPPDGTNVSGRLNITGTAEANPAGGPDPDAVEIRFGDGAEANVSLDGVDWSYEWDTTQFPDGPILLTIHSTAGDLRSEPVERTYNVTQGGTNGTTDDGGDSPGPGLWVVVAAAGLAAAVVRRRHER